MMRTAAQPTTVMVYSWTSGRQGRTQSSWAESRWCGGLCAGGWVWWWKNVEESPLGTLTQTCIVKGALHSARTVRRASHATIFAAGIQNREVVGGNR